MAHQAASTAPARVSDRNNAPARAAIEQLRRALIAGRNPDEGWAYYGGKSSRLEPTCWAFLALQLAKTVPATVDSASAWLMQRQRADGWLVENAEWPVNIAFNALAAVTLAAHGQATSDQTTRRVLESLLASKGVTAPQAANTQQDNSLQGWSWIDATFSWVEPTCWGMLAARKAGQLNSSLLAAARARVTEAERLLIDRSCQPGGWNFGNAVVMRQDLRPYVPTTALGLLAMQPRRDADAVVRALATLESIWPTEISATALGLSLICLDVYDRPTDKITAALIEHVPKAIAFGNHHGMAVALFALSSLAQPHALRL